MLRVTTKSVPVVAMLLSIVLAEVNVAVTILNSPTTRPIPGSTALVGGAPEKLQEQPSVRGCKSAPSS